VTPVVTEKYRPFVATSMTDLHVTVDGRDLEAVWTDDAPETRVALEDALPPPPARRRAGATNSISIALDVPLERQRGRSRGSIARWPAGKLCSFRDRRRPAKTVAAPPRVRHRVTDVEPLADLEDGGAGSARADGR